MAWALSPPQPMAQGHKVFFASFLFTKRSLPFQLMLFSIAVTALSQSPGLAWRL